MHLRMEFDSGVGPTCFPLISCFRGCLVAPKHKRGQLSRKIQQQISQTFKHSIKKYFAHETRRKYLS